jgi:hypothetical protein
MAVSLIGGGNRSMQRKNYIPTASYEQTWTYNKLYWVHLGS